MYTYNKSIHVDVSTYTYRINIFDHQPVCVHYHTLFINPCFALQPAKDLLD